MGGKKKKLNSCHSILKTKTDIKKLFLKFMKTDIKNL